MEQQTIPQIKSTVTLLLQVLYYLFNQLFLLSSSSVLFLSFTPFLIIFLPHFPIASYQMKWDMLQRTGAMCVCETVLAHMSVYMFGNVLVFLYWEWWNCHFISIFWQESSVNGDACCLAALHWGAPVVCVQRAGKRLWRMISLCTLRVRPFDGNSMDELSTVWSNLSICVHKGLVTVAVQAAKRLQSCMDLNESVTEKGHNTSSMFTSFMHYLLRNVTSSPHHHANVMLSFTLVCVSGLSHIFCVDYVLFIKSVCITLRCLVCWININKHFHICKIFF